jgi:hypothetical protein
MWKLSIKNPELFVRAKVSSSLSPWEWVKKGRQI